MGYKEDLDIDYHNLDIELNNQPKLFAHWAEAAVNAAYDRDKAKAFLELIEAELDIDIRKNPSYYNLEKVTDKAIANVITAHEKYQSALHKYIESVKETKTLEIARESFEQRKGLLIKEVDLFLSNYWAERDTNKKEDVVIEKQRQALEDNPRLKKIKQMKGV